MKKGKYSTHNVLCGVAALLVAFYFGIGTSCVLFAGNVRGSCGKHSVNRPDKIVFDAYWPPIDLARYAISPYETVRFPSRQAGIRITGWWAEARPAAPVVILVHGLAGCKNAIDVLIPAGMLWRNGFNVLLIDVRDVGDSDPEDGWTSIGNDESLDVLGALDWLAAAKGYAPEQVGLFGVSLGATTALYAFQEEPRIAALFLESTCVDPEEVLADQLAAHGLPAFLARPATELYRLMSGEDLTAHDPFSAIRAASGRPVYIVHSQADRRVDFHQSLELAGAALAAGVKVQAWFPEQSKHLHTPAVYPEEFERRLVGFFRETLKDG